MKDEYWLDPHWQTQEIEQWTQAAHNFEDSWMVNLLDSANSTGVDESAEERLAALPDVSDFLWRYRCAVGMIGTEREKWCCGVPAMCGDF